jgi:hypothetical protein
MRVNLEVTGKSVSELRENAVAELAHFVGRELTLAERITIDIDASPKLGHNGEYPNVVIWTAQVSARLDEGA